MDQHSSYKILCVVLSKKNISESPILLVLCHTSVWSSFMLEAPRIISTFSCVSCVSICILLHYPCSPTSSAFPYSSVFPCFLALTKSYTPLNILQHLRACCNIFLQFSMISEFFTTTASSTLSAFSHYYSSLFRTPLLTGFTSFSHPIYP
jgi:hypothetical protein